MTLYLFSLPGSDREPLCWTGASPQAARPELRLHEVELVGDAWNQVQEWSWRRTAP